MYDVCLYAYDTGLITYKGAIFEGGGSAGTDNLGTDPVPETTLGAGTWWVAATVDCGVNYYGNVV